MSEGGHWPSRSVSRDNDNGDDNEGGDERKRAVESFGPGLCVGGVERRHVVTPIVGSFYFLGANQASVTALLMMWR